MQSLDVKIRNNMNVDQRTLTLFFVESKRRVWKHLHPLERSSNNSIIGMMACQMGIFMGYAELENKV